MTQPGEDLHEFDSPRLSPDSRAVDAPEADAFEQALPAGPAPAPVDGRLPFEANEADAFEQSQVVELDEDYR